MKAPAVIEAYAVRSAEYVDRFGQIETAAEPDRLAVLNWALQFDGQLVDVGCGPGHWTSYLAHHDLNVTGIDPTPEFIAAARQRHPGLDFGVGYAEHLAVDDETLDGILSWYSLIHTSPESIDTALTEFARCLRPRGGLTIGFFAGVECVPFDHAVTTAYYWPVEQLSERIEACGFAVTSADTRVEPAARTHGFITATRI
ncbi:class I SAM-dependent methyltransferase [Demequina globuliformis]|uniref:class I SAM-dependent methyltransferase n=1 Tax=Demequina globuliformis TaxID=676202 RepID=UPI00078089F0|nr:class I SAM-dependent methyltransferase [Demequina globuliformis]